MSAFGERPPVDYSPVRVGRHVALRPLRPEDYGILFEIAMFTDAGSRWRLHGAVRTHDQFMQLLMQDSHATFVVEELARRRVLGMVQLWCYDPTSRNGQITAFLHPEARGRGWPLEGMLLFIDYVFPAFGLRKLYFESLATELPQYGSLVGTLLREEGVLREHKWVFGELVDCHVLALYAEDVPRLLRFLPERRGLPAPVASEVPDAKVIEALGSPDEAMKVIVDD